MPKTYYSINSDIHLAIKFALKPNFQKQYRTVHKSEINSNPTTLTTASAI